MVPEMGQGAGRFKQALLTSGSWAARSTSFTTAIDRHLKTYRKNKLALIWESEDGKTDRTFSYYFAQPRSQPHGQHHQGDGRQKGDRVTIYMGRIPEIVFAMLACAKIGAIHSVVFGGFSVDALQGRIEDSQSKLVITCDGAFQNGKIVELKADGG
jgi:acetyl-CoA synthetase